MDRVRLNAPATRPARSRRWIAVGTVAALAAAIVVAVVLVAPWRGTPQQRNPVTATAPSPAKPPTGMQWVSFHGLTFTLPASWPVLPTYCEATGAVFAVVGHDGGKCELRQPIDQVEVSITSLGTMAAEGGPVSIAGLAARRLDGFGSPLSVGYVQFQIPDLDVLIRIGPGNQTVVDTLVRGIARTPVDHFGCTEKLPMLTDANGTPGAVDVAGVTSAVVCEYDVAARGVPSLLGSRALTTDELDRLKGALTSAAPQLPGDAAPLSSIGELVYRLERPGRSTSTVWVDPSRTPISVTDGNVYSTLGTDRLDQLPRAYW